jgi:DNA-binding FadR family transcriptional regulator
MSFMPKSALDNLKKPAGRFAGRGKVAKPFALFRHAETATVSEETKSYNINTTGVRLPSRSEMILPVLVDYISDMKLGPGSKLPSEFELSKITGVSIKSLREALQTLKMLGLIDSRAGAGWYVIEFKATIILPAVMGPVLQRFSGVNVYQAFQARLGIEPLIAELAATSITADGLVELRQALEVMRKNAVVHGVSKEFRAADRKFHDILAEMCGNKVLSLQNSILSGLFLSMYEIIPDSDDYRVLREHEEIYRKIEARDADGAALAAQRHLKNALLIVKKKKA